MVQNCSTQTHQFVSVSPCGMELYVIKKSRNDTMITYASTTHLSDLFYREPVEEAFKIALEKGWLTRQSMHSLVSTKEVELQKLLDEKRAQYDLLLQKMEEQRAFQKQLDKKHAPLELARHRPYNVAIFEEKHYIDLERLLEAITDEARAAYAEAKEDGFKMKFILIKLQNTQ